MIKINNLHYSYDNIKVLDDINLEINKSEIISVLGKSGAGKTTLLNLIGTLDTIQDGEIFINGKLINNLSLKELYKLRNEEIGFVFQFHNLLPEFTALENICLPAFIKGITKKEAEKKAYELLKKLELTNRAQHKPNQLSGGEKQRISICRALINSPSFVLADEPTGNLDSHNTEIIYKLFQQLNNEFGYTFVIITHNNNFASIGKKKVFIQDGKII
tara:strand:+ start:20072 stop:20722 length:651 start_codon:yes stop_codon:yes gene_type:complete